MNIQIRKAKEEDFPAILSLIKELALFEKSPEKVTNSMEQMQKEKDYFGSYVAEYQSDGKKQIVGFALYFFAYYTWVGKSLYLDDIFIKQEFRGKKIASALFKKVFELARKENCKRVRWQVINWNQDAIDIYKAYGAKIDNQWSNCDFDAVAIDNFKEN